MEGFCLLQNDGIRYPHMAYILMILVWINQQLLYIQLPQWIW